MADNLTLEQRRRLMSSIRTKDTALEIVVRSRLHKAGFRFNKHVASLPGRPDIVFPRKRIVVFVDGDFWHGWRLPQWRDSLSRFWQDKIESNRRRDQRNFAKLRRRGWLVLRLWGHEIHSDAEAAVRRVIAMIESLR